MLNLYTNQVMTRFYGFSLVSIPKHVKVIFKQKTSPPSVIACHATLHPALLVGQSVGQSIGLSISGISVCMSFYYCKCILQIAKNDKKWLKSTCKRQKLANACKCLHMLAHACKCLQMLANDKKKMTKDDKK